MKSALLLLLGLCATSVFAQPDTTWTRRISIDSGSASIEAATVLVSGETMIATGRYANAEVDLWRLSSSGETVWNGSVSAPTPQFGIIGMVQMDEGHLILALVAILSDQGGSASLVLKGITTSGTELWESRMQYDMLNFTGASRKLSDNTVAIYITNRRISEPAEAIMINASSAGDSLWSRAFGPIGTDIQAHDFAELSNGDLVVVGMQFDANWNSFTYLMRATRTGESVWLQTYSNEGQAGPIGTALDVALNDEILVGGYDNSAHWFYVPWAKKLNPDGDEIWTLSGVVNGNCAINGIRHTTGGGAAFIGTGISDVAVNHVQVYSIDQTGAATLEARFDATACYVHHMNNFGPRGAVAYGAILDSNSNQYGFVLKFGPGTVVGGVVRELGSNHPVPNARVELLETSEFSVTDAEGRYTIGVSQTTGTLRVSSPCIATYEQTVELVEGEENILDFSVGVPEYQNTVSSVNMVATFGIAERDTLFISNPGNGDLVFTTTTLEQTPTYGWLSVFPESGVIPAGETGEIVVTVLASAEHPASEFFGEVLIHHNSCPDTVSEIGVLVLALDSPEEPDQVSSFALHAAYPNPFNNTARVAFDLPQTAQVNAKLYSIDGREAATLTNAQYTAGRHELAINGDALATGVYLLRLTAGAAVATQKLVLLK